MRKEVFCLDSRTRRLAYLGLLIALSVVLTRFASVRIALLGVEGIRIGFGGFPIIMAGVLYGPLAGAAVGAIADVVGFAMSPMGPYMPHFTLTSALTGALPALFISAARTKAGAPPSLGLLLGAITFGQTITSVLLVPYFLQSLFGMPWQVILPPRLISQAVSIPAYALLLHLLLRRVPGLAPRWETAAAARGPSDAGR
ncbi:MAG TPA: folate family ECF transporter S component [Clostridiales bacterium]|nr:folate family ECF transporter S component [Clostridiales bacterium]